MENKEHLVAIKAHLRKLQQTNPEMTWAKMAEVAGVSRKMALQCPVRRAAVWRPVLGPALFYFLGAAVSLLGEKDESF